MTEVNNVIHYVDAGNFYSIYGIATLVIVLLLLWYFIRSHISQDYYSETCTLDKAKQVAEPKESTSREGITMEDPNILAYMPEFQKDSPYDYNPIQITPEDEPKPYKFTTGSYGGVQFNIYDTNDVIYKPEWDHNKAAYIPNMRTVFKQTYTPIEASFWGVSSAHHTE